MLLSRADKLWGLVDKRDEIAIFGGIAPSAWGRRELGVSRRPLSKELRTLAGGGRPDVTEKPNKTPRGRHGGTKLRQERH